MIRFFRTIRQNLLTQGRVTRYLTYATGEDLLDTNANLCPARDSIWVEGKIVVNSLRAVRYGIWNLRDGIENHMAYLTARNNIFIRRFYPYAVPNGTAQDYNHRI